MKKDAFDQSGSSPPVTHSQRLAAMVNANVKAQAKADKRLYEVAPWLDEYQISPADLFDTLQPGDRFTARFCSTRSTYKVISTGYRADCVAHTKTPLIWVARYNLAKHRYNRTEKWTKEMFVGRRAVSRG